MAGSALHSWSGFAGGGRRTAAERDLSATRLFEGGLGGFPQGAHGHPGRHRLRRRVVPDPGRAKRQSTWNVAWAEERFVADPGQRKQPHGTSLVWAGQGSFANPVQAKRPHHSNIASNGQGFVATSLRAKQSSTTNFLRNGRNGLGLVQENRHTDDTAPSNRRRFRGHYRQRDSLQPTALGRTHTGHRCNGAGGHRGCDTYRNAHAHARCPSDYPSRSSGYNGGPWLLHQLVQPRRPSHPLPRRLSRGHRRQFRLLHQSPRVRRRKLRLLRQSPRVRLRKLRLIRRSQQVRRRQLPPSHRSPQVHLSPRSLRLRHRRRRSLQRARPHPPALRSSSSVPRVARSIMILATRSFHPSIAIRTLPTS